MSLHPHVPVPHPSPAARLRHPWELQVSVGVPAWQGQVSPLQGWDISSGQPRAALGGPQCPVAGREPTGSLGPPCPGAGAVPGHAVVPRRQQLAELLREPLEQAAAKVGSGVGGQRWGPCLCPALAAELVKSCARIVGCFAGSKLWVFGCHGAKRATSHFSACTVLLCLHRNLQRQGCQLGGE